MATPRPLETGERDPVPIVQEAGWKPETELTGAENFAPTAIRYKDGPADRELLYRLSHSGYITSIRM